MFDTHTLFKKKIEGFDFLESNFPSNLKKLYKFPNVEEFYLQLYKFFDVNKPEADKLPNYLLNLNKTLNALVVDSDHQLYETAFYAAVSSYFQDNPKSCRFFNKKAIIGALNTINQTLEKCSSCPNEVIREDLKSILSRTKSRLFYPLNSIYSSLPDNQKQDMFNAFIGNFGGDIFSTSLPEKESHLLLDRYFEQHPLENLLQYALNKTTDIEINAYIKKTVGYLEYRIEKCQNLEEKTKLLKDFHHIFSKENIYEANKTSYVITSAFLNCSNNPDLFKLQKILNSLDELPKNEDTSSSSRVFKPRNKI